MKKTLTKVLSVMLVLLMSSALIITASAAISRNEAEEIALKAVGVNRADASIVYSEADYELGSLYKYEVTIYVTNPDGSYTEYDVDVRVSDGTVLSQSKELNQAPPPNVQQPNGGNAGGVDIGAERAKQNALNAFGIVENSAKRLTVRKDYDDGRLVYEVQFFVGNDEYDCDVDAYTGEVINMEIDHEEPVGGFFGAISRFFKMIAEWLRSLFSR